MFFFRGACRGPRVLPLSLLARLFGHAPPPALLVFPAYYLLHVPVHHHLLPESLSPSRLGILFKYIFLNYFKWFIPRGLLYFHYVALVLLSFGMNE